MVEFIIVKKVIDKWDPYGFFKSNVPAPDNEYDIESREICNQITLESTQEYISLVIANVFTHAFGQKFIPEHCLVPSIQIYKSLNNK